MRRTMLFLLAVSFLGSMTGCCLTQTHGMCDCDFEDHCSSRAPWTRYGPQVAPQVAPTSEAIPAPIPAKALPDGKKDL